jgi:hypothetical protein
MESLWFSRMWIVQECTLATNPLFLFGNFIIEWNHLRKAYMRLDLPRHLTDEYSHRVGRDISRMCVVRQSSFVEISIGTIPETVSNTLVWHTQTFY